jgi:23S rRNA pseudouridine2605 synthase
VSSGGATTTEEEGDGERLQKVLARAGIGSRRACDELIAAGRVLVNGLPARLGQRVEVTHDVVLIDGAPVGILPGLVYYLLNKPEGVIATASDPEGRPTVTELLPSSPRVFSVGRLDAATSGLLIMTNDGELAQVVAHPSNGVEKEYLAEVVGDPTPQALRRLREGVEIEPGIVTKPARVAKRAPGVLRIVIHEGRNRQVRRMCDAVGYPVKRLVRTRIGPISDIHLQPGEFRELSQKEVRELALAAASGHQVKPGK